MLKNTNLFLHFYDFIKEQKILLFIFCLPIFVLALILARLYFSIDLLSNPLILFVLSIEFASFFIILISNSIFCIQNIYLYFTNNQTFLITFFKNLKKIENFKKVSLLFYTFSFSVPIKVLFTIKHPIFNILTTLTTVFFVWVFSLHFFLFLYWTVMFYLLFDAFYYYYFYANVVNFFKNNNIDNLFGENKDFKMEYCDFFFGTNFKTKCFYKILHFILSFSILYICYSQELLEWGYIDKIVVYLQDNDPELLDLPSIEKDSSETNTYFKNLNQLQDEIILTSTTFLKIKKILKKKITNFLTNSSK